MKRIWKYFISVTLIMGILLVLVQTQTKAEVYKIDKSKIPEIGDYPKVCFRVTLSGTDISYEGMRIADSSVKGVAKFDQLVLLDTGNIELLDNAYIGTLVLTGANSISTKDGAAISIGTLVALDKNTKIGNVIVDQYQVADLKQVPKGAVGIALSQEQQQNLGEQFAGSNWESTPASGSEEVRPASSPQPLHFSSSQTIGLETGTTSTTSE